MMEHYLEANPVVVLREEFDDWAVLFDPETGAGFGLNPVGVFVWKHLDGRHSTADILEAMRKQFAQVPDDAPAHLEELVQALVDKGLVGKVMRQGVTGQRSREAKKGRAREFTQRRKARKG